MPPRIASWNIEILFAAGLAIIFSREPITKDADQSVWVHRLVCTFVVTVCMHQNLIYRDNANLINYKSYDLAGLENSTRQLIFTSASGCRASENLIFLVKNKLFPYMPIIFVMQGK